MNIIRDGSLVGLLFCLAVAIGTVIWAGYEVVHWFDMFQRMPEVITLNKGAPGLIGGSMAFFVFSVMGINWIRGYREPTENQQIVLSRLTVISLIIMLALPILTYWPARLYLTEQNYKICDSDPLGSIRFQDTIYVLDTNDCPYGYSG